VTLAGIRTMVAICNPEAGGGQFRRDLPLMLDLLRSFGLQVERRDSEEPGHGMELARQAVVDGADAVCAIGGDGTVNEVINGIAETGVPLLIVPAGTVNVLAAELGVPLEPADACRLAGSGHLSWIDLGKAGERYFALMAGVGMDAAVVQSMNPMLKKVLREAAFALQGAATVLKGDFPRVRVETAEQSVEGYFVVLGNASNYGGAFGITPMASMRDGLLDVCVLQSVSPLSTLQYWLGALVQSHLKQQQVQYWRTKDAQITVVGEGEVLVQTDGEMAGQLPMSMRVVPRALSVIVP
jgi:YegS/Rv2252/BmrU family lipid kinase